MNFTADAVLALSPDDASAKAARGLTSPGKWPLLGSSEAAVWGECQGSGSKPYQTQVDLAGPAFRCSCPSRKFPCKHGLALLLIRCSDPALFRSTAVPAWVDEWLASRRDQAERKERRSTEKAAAPPPSPEAIQKREAQRWSTIEAGLSQLELWMTDHVQQGLANIGSDQRAGFEAVAARLVDAQAPGLGQRLREVAQHIGSAADWPARVLQCFGKLQLAIEAVRRRGTLAPGLQADLRVALGWPMDKEDVMAVGERVEDEWAVLGVAVQDREAKLVERRVWLQGLQSGRRALLLDFAFGTAGFDSAWITGERHAMVLAFFPASSPLRALVAERRAPQPAAVQLPPGAADEWLEMARRRAANPWLPLVPMMLDDAVPEWQDGSWWIRTAGNVLPARLADEAGWLLSAHGGGHAGGLFGEWDGDRFTPLTASSDAGLWINTAPA